MDGDGYCRPRPRAEQPVSRYHVLRPKLGDSRIGRWLAARLGAPCYRIRLDDIGTIIWKACDGETPLTEMGRRLRDAFGERVEPAGERLARFVRMMLRSRMIEA